MKQLWREVFDDSREYIEDFFLAVSPLETGLCAFEGESLAGMLFSLPAVMTVRGASYDACYLYAVATAPTFRRQGVFRQLEAEACRLAKERGCRYAALVPEGEQLFAFYQRLGYRVRFYLGVSEVPAAVVSNAVITDCPKGDFLTFRRDMLRRMENSFDFYPALCEYRFQELKNSGNDLLRVQNFNETGYLAGRIHGGDYHISETSLSNTALAEAAGKLQEIYPIRRVFCTGRYGRRFPFGMIKSLNGVEDISKLRGTNPYMNLMFN